MHVSPTLVAPTPRQFVGFFDFILETLGFRLWFLRHMIGWPRDQQLVSFLSAVGARPLQSGYELAFVRRV